jgi:hypothetical protein
MKLNIRGEKKMKKAEFKEEGKIFCRGEEVCKYSAGDKVGILEELGEEVNIVVLEGEAKGITMITDKSQLK